MALMRRLQLLNRFILLVINWSGYLFYNANNGLYADGNF
jgi:cell division protein FtsB